MSVFLGILVGKDYMQASEHLLVKKYVEHGGDMEEMTVEVIMDVQKNQIKRQRMKEWEQVIARQS